MTSPHARIPANIVLKELAAILRFSSAMVATRLFSFGQAFVVLLLAGRESAVDLASLAVVVSIIQVVIVLGFSALIGTETEIAKSYGAEDRNRVAEMLLTSLVFGACLGTILALIVFGATPFVRAAGPFVTGPSNVAGLLESAHDPLVIALCGMPLQFVYAAASFYFEATRQPKIVTSLAILGLITATGSALLLIPNQAKFGLSTAAAAALSFTVPRIVQGVGSLVLSLSQQRRLWPLFLGLLRDRFWANVKCLVHIGLPMSVSDGTTTVAVMSMTFLIGVLGVSALNVYQITSQFLAVLMLVGSGLCTSIVIRVTNAVGARDNQSQIVTFRAGLIALCILDMLAFSLYAAFPNAWANLYKAGAEVATGVHANQLWALLIFAIECPLILLTGIARAHSQMVRLPVIKAVCFVIIAIPLCYFVTRNLVAPTGYLLFGIVPTVAFALGIAVWQVTRASMPSPAPDQIHMH